ncbi:methylated-DNA--[protein]-cysteine S-methyltransferase [Ornithinibacillus sp. L9]|uniref:methylated-DNA--[protein]-cysteine S-methyltransferase n=1 Tax=Ornithinibacillus caprae TaxID=2678566 RepID=A0A6N8FEE7_9BACI|nr:methylated-DNA--[protein]-cysteine S-methyltransferase [Ornithinibacillus caprae]MUK87785.1 methylated-DNA--[protein]-cysteine S-methyltransferase [Ornithinibacillus caprae]
MKTDQVEIYWTLLDGMDGHMYIAATTTGLCFVGSQNKSFEELTEWVKKHYPGSSLTENKEKLKYYVDEILEYQQGKRKTFTCPIDLNGTAFQHVVWEALREIPYGQTTSYSDIANKIDKPTAVRAVGAAIGANPLLITVPCHRVVAKNGSLTGYRGGLEMKKQLLELERRGSGPLSQT